eukprot:1147694-Pelagomonas_calceolata.AAC.14
MDQKPQVVPGADLIYWDRVASNNHAQTNVTISLWHLSLLHAALLAGVGYSSQFNFAPFWHKDRL